jgi:hypothetical protein
MNFYVGLHMPSHADRFKRCMISVNRLRDRKSEVPGTCAIMLDSGSFTEVERNGRFAWSGGRWQKFADAVECIVERNPGRIVAAVQPDFMCEPGMREKLNSSTITNIGHTVDMYMHLMDRWNGKPPCYILPVLQGYEPEDYVRCLYDFGSNISPPETPSREWTFGLLGERYLKRGAWVGVGSVCKRNTDPKQIVAVLRAIKDLRPDLRLHGFGVKLTALRDPEVRSLLYSADSMAWSFHARMHGRSGNDVNEAIQYVHKVERELVTHCNSGGFKWTE